MIEKRKRGSFEEMALRLAREAADCRSEDPYVQVGACALRHDNSIAGIGYNGTPPKVNDIDWSDREHRRTFIVHAEINCLRYSKPGECRIIAVTLLPCAQCMLTIGTYGIKKVIFGDVYDKDKSALEVASKFGIELIQMSLPVSKQKS